jgi:hydroxylysine kinase
MHPGPAPPLPQTADLAGSLLSLPPPQLDAKALLTLAANHWGVTGTLTRLTSERDLNHRLDSREASFTLKLANSAEPVRMTDFQTAALLHVARTDPGLSIPRVLPTLDGRHVIPLPEGALRLLTWCPGMPLARLPLSPALASTIGDALARLTLALQGFDHPGADHVLLWDIKQFPRLAPLVPDLPSDLQASITGFRHRFQTTIAPALIDLPAQVVHSDFNLHNLLADPADPSRITGILDFGDMVRTHRICDLAVSAAYLVDPEDPLTLLLPLVTAYNARLPLFPAELALLPDLIRARMLTSLAISTWRAARYPDNAEYILRNAPTARAGLAAFAATDADRLADALRHACESPAR